MIKIVVRFEKLEIEEKLRCVGVNKVINLFSMVGIYIVKGIVNLLIVYYIDIVLYGIEQLFVIEEILVGKDLILVGKLLLESNVRNQFDVIILVILRNGDIIYNLVGQEKLKECDMIIVFGLVEKLG